MMPTGGNSIPTIPSQVKTLFSLFNLDKNLVLIKQLHAQIIINGFHRSILFGSKISNAYIELGSFGNASEAFREIHFKNRYLWNKFISEHSNKRRFIDVLRLCKGLRVENYLVDSFNLVFAIKACIGLSVLPVGKCFHSDAIKLGLDFDSYVAPTLIAMYIELGTLEEAQKVFERISQRNSVIWGAMMKGYLKFNKECEVFKLLLQMRKSGIDLDPFSAEGLIRACGIVCAGKEGQAFHARCVKWNFIDSNIYLQTSLVDMYMKCGLLDNAIKLFVEIPYKDVVLWSAMVDGLAKNGKAYKAISLFKRMLEEAIKPNIVTFASVLIACSHLGALQQGKSVHAFVIRNGVEIDAVNYTAFIDMYAKCGCIWMAYKVFDEMPKRNVFSWGAMINGFGIHGLYSEAFTLFSQMRYENHVPNSITFVSILSACSHAGRIEEGQSYFESMSRDYGITPTEEHYACIVDILGRAGRIDEAEAFIDRMPIKPSACVWGALLGACRIHKRVEVAERAVKKLLVLEPDQAGVYVLVSNIYASVGMWEMVKKVRFILSEKKIQKPVGISLIEVENKVYEFSAKDRLAYRDIGIQAIWSSLSEQMRELGYAPDIRFVLHDVEDELKQEILSGL